MSTKKSITFGITCHNEVESLAKLLKQMEDHLKANVNDSVLVLDDHSNNQETIKILDYYKNVKGFEIHQHALNKHFGDHKTYLNTLCKGAYIFQLDADEYLADGLIDNIHEIIESNDVDFYVVPRVNILRGLEQQYVDRWGWRVSKLEQFFDEKTFDPTSEEYKYLLNNRFIITDFLSECGTRIAYYLPIINWEGNQDRQGRLYRNKPEIRWERKLHEFVTGYKTIANLPGDPDLAIIHDKTIEKQIKQNTYYNTNFTMEDNIRR